jgi:ribonuclease HII
MRAPTLRVERSLFREGATLLGGVDEVGRGALGGPVSVGIVVIDESCRTAPSGVRDSKLLTPPVRESLVRPIQKWARDYAVGSATAVEIDTFGLTAALRLAGWRALAALQTVPDVVLLDGSFDWLTIKPEALSLFDEALPIPKVAGPSPQVRTQVKADMTCSSVAAASVLAKVKRDAFVCGLEEVYPGYYWKLHKGYCTPEHLQAVRELGLTDQHRRSWRTAASVEA